MRWKTDQQQFGGECYSIVITCTRNNYGSSTEIWSIKQKSEKEGGREKYMYVVVLLELPNYKCDDPFPISGSNHAQYHRHTWACEVPVGAGNTGNFVCTFLYIPWRK